MKIHAVSTLTAPSLALALTASLGIATATISSAYQAPPSSASTSVVSNEDFDAVQLAATAASTTFRYRVSRTTSVRALAKRWKTSTSRLARINHVSPGAKFRKGKIVRIPRTTTHTKVYRASKTLSVRSYAKKFHTSTSRLARINKISTRSTVRRGTYLLIPRKNFDAVFSKKVTKVSTPKTSTTTKTSGSTRTPAQTPKVPTPSVPTPSTPKPSAPTPSTPKPVVTPPKPAPTYEEVIASKLAQFGCAGESFTVGPTRGDAWGLTSLGNGHMTFIPGMTGGARDYIVAHECAHNKQVRVWAGDSTMVSTLNKIYSSTGYMGLEYNADCATIAQGQRYQGYTTDCSGARLAAGVALNKFQKP